jgi:hypothetical protein
MQYLICSVGLEQMKKVLTIRTPIKIINKTKLKIELCFMHLSDVIMSYEIPYEKDLAIPLDFIQVPCAIKHELQEDMSETFILTQISAYLASYQTVIWCKKYS